MYKAMQTMAMACLLVVSFYAIAADDCGFEQPICFGVNWKTATEQAVRDWLKSTGDVKVKAKNGATALHLAALNNENPAIISILLEAGADVNAKDKLGDTPLHSAEYGNESPLVKAGADVNTRWSRTRTRLP